MNPIEGAGASTLFAVTAGQAARLESLAAHMLSAGISAYQSGDYEGAARDFRRSIGLSPTSDTALNAYDFMAMASLKLGRPDDAIKAYQSAVRTAPTRDDLFQKLGNLFYDQGRYAEAEAAYASAVRLAPRNSVYLIGLGQSLLSQGKFGDAEAAFRKVSDMSPNDKAGYYALGQAYYREGRIEDAITQFRKALDLDPDFAFGRLDLGSAYADLGRREEARAELSILQKTDAATAAALELYMHRVSSPQMVLAFGSDGFNPFSGPGTRLSGLDASLAVPAASKEFTLQVYFDKAMDMTSVMDPLNWSISRASGTAPGGFYNYGLPLPSTEIAPPPLPVRILYDRDAMSAAVTFRLTQNSTGDGTIDPSHIIFRFMGKDAYGKRMDRSADEFSGFSRIA